MQLHAPSVDAPAREAPHIQRTPIDNPDDPRLAPFRDLKDAQLKSREHLFLAEGRFVVPVLLSTESRFQPAAILGTSAALDATHHELAHAAAVADQRCPVYEATQAVMDTVAGFHIHRGLIAAGKRTPVPTADQLLAHAAPALSVAVEDLTNHDNLGGLFRNAAAFAASALFLSPRCCDPLYRKCVRVSMGHALRVPFATWHAGAEGVHQLHHHNLTTIALDPAPDAPTLDRALAEHDRTKPLALVVGAEGDGLSRGARHAAHHRARIPMTPNTDSLNTATATGIALHAAATARHLLRQPPQPLQ